MPPSAWVGARATHFAVRLTASLALAAVITAPATAQRVRVSALTDISFGMLANLQSDQRRSQSICVYSNGNTSGYSVSAWGSGSAGSFEISNGSNSLNYDVEWNPVAGLSTGAALTPNLPLTGQVSSASNQTCNSGPAASASLVVILRGGDLGQAREGTYTGSLSLLISPE
jgi:hypothetical protein